MFVCVWFIIAVCTYVREKTFVFFLFLIVQFAILIVATLHGNLQFKSSAFEPCFGNIGLQVSNILLLWKFKYIIFYVHL